MFVAFPKKPTIFVQVFVFFLLGVFFSPHVFGFPEKTAISCSLVT